MRDARLNSTAKLKNIMLLLFVVAVVCGVSYRIIDFRFQRVPESFNWAQSNIEKFVDDTSRQPYTEGSGMDILRQLLGLGEWSLISLAFLFGFIVQPLLDRKFRRGGLSTNSAVGLALSCIIILSFVGINLVIMR